MFAFVKNAVLKCAPTEMFCENRPDTLILLHHNGSGSWNVNQWVELKYGMKWDWATDFSERPQIKKGPVEQVALVSGVKYLWAAAAR